MFGGIGRPSAATDTNLPAASIFGVVRQGTPASTAPSSPMAFGSSSTTAFGLSTSPASIGPSQKPTKFGSPVFGSTTSPPAFGESSSTRPSSTFGSAPAFGHPTRLFGTSSFGVQTTFGPTPPTGTRTAPFSRSSSTFGSGPVFGQPSSFGVQTTTPAFGISNAPIFGSSCGPALGSAQSTPSFGLQWKTPASDGVAFPQPMSGRVAPYRATATKYLQSISAMPDCREMSHEELRWGDYQRGDKGGSSFAQANPFVGQTSSSSSIFPAISVQKPGFDPPRFVPSAPSIFGTCSTNLFGSPFGTVSASGSSSAAATTCPFGTVSASGSSSAAATTCPFGTGGRTQTPVLQTTRGSCSSCALRVQPASSDGNLPGASNSLAPPSSPIRVNETTSHLLPSLSSKIQSVTSAPTQPASSSGPASIPNASNQNSVPVASQSDVDFKPAPVCNPFGTLPALPQMPLGRAGGGSSPVQYGISSLPVSEKPTPMRLSSVLMARRQSLKRIKLPARKYHPGSDGPKVPFFCAPGEAPSTPKADALFIPRENPRALLIGPIDQWSAGHTSSKNLFAGGP